jgi:hypothetical protein
MNTEQWIVGDEHDERLVAALNGALLALGYSIGKRSYGMAGSQELSTWIASGPNGTLTIETETYVGLSVRGEVRLLDELKRQFAATPQASPGRAPQ